jgi:isoquinoline 1-oxidoreductase subunit beta
MSLARRDFLKSSAMLSGGLVIALSLPGCGKQPSASGELKVMDFNAWLKVGTDNTITFLCDRSEMGQGVYTSLAMLVAEELGVALNRIQVQFAPAAEVYTNKLLGTQMTGGSTSIRDAWERLRTAGAQARAMLLTAAAEEWNVKPQACRVDNGTIVSPHGKKLTFGEVAEAASKLQVPEKVTLKDPQSFTLIGTPARRLDSPMKVDGTAQYGIDVKLPGMLYAALAQSPTLGGKVKTVDDSVAKTMPGYKATVQTSSGVAVVADSWFRARKARDALKLEWDNGPNAALNDAAILRGLQKASAGTGKVARQEGDANAALKSAAKVVSREYTLPLLAHATLEPQNCTADVRADRCDLYAPTQIQLVAQATAAKAAGLKPEQVNVHTTFLGGGFGRRLDVDFIPAAVEASKAVGKPVKLVWTREDDTTHDTYRPPAYNTISGGFDKDGRFTAFRLHLTGPSVTARMFPSVVEKNIDPFVIEGAANYPYDVPNILVDYVQHEIGIDVGYLRSVSHALNCFVVESFMDELAWDAKKDPVEFRMGLLEKQPRYREVLKLATREAGYGSPRKGRTHGVALMEGYGTYMAQVAEISLGEDGKPKVHRIVCALDCGQTVNPDTVMAQVESSIVFGLSATLWGEINLRNGRVQQTNFDTYRLLRMNEVPRIDTYIVESREAPGGVGEPAVALVAPAVCNAIYTATGRRLRSLPISRHRLA